MQTNNDQFDKTDKTIVPKMIENVLKVNKTADNINKTAEMHELIHRIRQVEVRLRNISNKYRRLKLIDKT